MNATETWTVGRLLTWTTDYLKKQGSESARLDAEILLAHARECERIQLYTAFDEEPTEEQRTAFREMVRRRAEGSPVAYLVGYKEFYSAPFEVNSDVLIPRPETEHLIVEALDCAKELRELRGDSAAALTVADIGTGSGAVAVTLANHLSGARIFATDISNEALAVAQKNAETHECSADRLSFHQGNLLEPIRENGPFDLIVSNPPYVSAEEYANLAASVRDYEPKTALVADQGGAGLILELLEQAAPVLAADGRVVIEYSPMLASTSESWLPQGWKPLRRVKDYADHQRVLTLVQRGE
ncbi:MAG: peptide chain release factor N(5)-glutamine methyltransferase [Planctomycetota bacterium]